MKSPLSCLAVLLAAVPTAALSQATQTLEPVVVTDRRVRNAQSWATTLDESGLPAKRSATSDTARLLQDVPGLSLYSAGGVSSLPAIRGLADDRLRIQVDGMDLTTACPNHMNSPLSYIDPTRVGSVSVFAGITPVSVGGDSIGGTIQVKSAPPEFADSAETTYSSGQAGAFYRSNGNGYGYNLGAVFAGQDLSASYSGSSAQSSNYFAGSDFKPAGPGTAGGPWLAGNEVASTAFTARNQDIGFALRQAGHLLRLNVGMQRAPFEGFPNQRMDMVGNDSTQVNLRYWGQFDWGLLEARAYGQDTEHFMNMGPDRFSYGTNGMPMNTKATTRGAMVQGEIAFSDISTMRVGAEYQAYTLYDWWPPAGGVMGPRTFWNIDFGTRNRAGIFGEWEALWSEQWVTQLGARIENVVTNAGPVQGYNSLPIWSVDAAAFNALQRRRSDNNLDLTALARYSPGPTQTFEAGMARKSRSPNLYQRYAWTTQPMATLMNNFAGDGNGYVGDVNLKPEVAHTISASGDWHDADKKHWSVKATGSFTLVQNFVDARRCNFGQCGGEANVTPPRASSTCSISISRRDCSASICPAVCCWGVRPTTAASRVPACWATSGARIARPATTCTTSCRSIRCFPWCRIGVRGPTRRNSSSWRRRRTCRKSGTR